MPAGRGGAQRSGAWCIVARKRRGASGGAAHKLPASLAGLENGRGVAIMSEARRLPSESIRVSAALPEPRRLGAHGYPDENAGASVAPRISFPHLWRPSGTS